MRVNGATVKFEPKSFRPEAEKASMKFLRMCFTRGYTGKELTEAAQRVTQLVNLVRESGEEW